VLTIHHAAQDAAFKFNVTSATLGALVASEGHFNGIRRFHTLYSASKIASQDLNTSHHCSESTSPPPCVQSHVLRKVYEGIGCPSMPSLGRSLDRHVKTKPLFLGHSGALFLQTSRYRGNCRKECLALQCHKAAMGFPDRRPCLLPLIMGTFSFSLNHLNSVWPTCPRPDPLRPSIFLFSSNPGVSARRYKSITRTTTLSTRHDALPRRCAAAARNIPSDNSGGGIHAWQVAPAQLDT
jgi:hypothetical protein